MSPTALENPKNYINRDISWLAFNQRVLEEAEDESNPLMERVKFLAISASNLDQFFELRVAGLLQQVEDREIEPGPDGLSPAKVVDLLKRDTHAFCERQYGCWNRQLKPALAENGVLIRSLDDLDASGREFIETYCERELDPLLTPVTIDPAHPFPRVINKALCLALMLRRNRRGNGLYLGVVTVPRALPRLLRLPGEPNSYIWLAELLAWHARHMYRGFEIVSHATFRITRNSNLYVQEEEHESLLESVRAELRNRHKGDAVRLEIEAGADAQITTQLRDKFELAGWQVFESEGPVALSQVMQIYELTDRPDLKFRSFGPRELSLSRRSENIFDEIDHRDILIHTPFDSFETVTRFLETAAEDPAVLSIKQTLYRTGEHSRLIDALVHAARQKEVTAVVELKARFDEAANIRWARYLEDAGVQVFHGLVGLKTHCKMALVLRRSDDGATRRYAHFSTGNYNPESGSTYTDLSLFTADEELTAAAHNLFHFLTAYAEQSSYDPLLVAPLDLAESTLALIARETEAARCGRPARIIAKINGLLDQSVIHDLYRASETGVSIDLIVRGMCALRPGMPRLSRNIRVRSIVGRFLEHSRIFYFENSGNPELYLGSADWMPRNLYHRVEILFPVRKPALRDRVKREILDAYLADVVKARVLRRDGSYHKPAVTQRKAGGYFNAQQFFIDVAEGRLSAANIPQSVRQLRLAKGRGIRRSTAA
jgi:polyphosphate kinase